MSPFKGDKSSVLPLTGIDIFVSSALPLWSSLPSLNAGALGVGTVTRTAGRSDDGSAVGTLGKALETGTCGIFVVPGLAGP